MGLDHSWTLHYFMPQHPNTTMHNLNSQLAEQVLAMDLRTNDGSLGFGFVDSTKYHGPLISVPRQTYYTNWFVAPGTYAINGVAASTGPFATTAHIDSGTTNIIVNQTIIDAYYAQVPGAYIPSGTGSYAFPCNLVTQGKMPSFGVYLGGQLFTVPESYMWASRRDSTYCSGVLEPTSSKSNPAYSAYLGQMFLSTQYVVFNYTEGGSVEFAAKASLAPTPTP